MAIVAFAKLSQITNDEKYLTIAKRTADFILQTMKKEDGSLFHRYKDGEVKFEGLLDDYAFLIWGLMELYQTDFEEKYLFEAYGLMNKLFEHFWDNENGGFLMTANYVKDLILRPQDITDRDIPSGNSIALINLVKLARILGNKDLEDKAKQLINAFSYEISLAPSYHTAMMMGLDLLINGTKEVVIVDDTKHYKRYMGKFLSEFNPFSLVVLKTKKSKINCISNFIGALDKRNDKPTVYICENFLCKMATNNLDDLFNI